MMIEDGLRRRLRPTNWATQRYLKILADPEELQSLVWLDN
jgi:hypothetical protein